MDGSTILVKTAKGVEEIKHRSADLTPTQRALLIMVDGATSLAGLLSRTAQIPTAEQCLAWLVRQGYLEAASGGAADASAAGPASIPPPLAGGSGLPPKQALIALSRELLGADAAKVIQRLQDVPDTLPELAAAIDRCHKFIKLTIDENKAAQFLRMSQSLLNEPR